MANLYGYNSSSAYKLDYNHELNKKTEEKRLHEEQVKKAVVKRKNPAKSLANFLKVAVCFAVAFAIVNGYVEINEANNEIAKLEAEYNDIVADNQALQMKIDKAVDLESLQAAAEKLGMVRPEQYQMIYIDMEQEDFAEIPDEAGESEEQTSVKGVAGSMTGTLNIFN